MSGKTAPLTPSSRPGLVFNSGCEASLMLPLLFVATVWTSATNSRGSMRLASQPVLNTKPGRLDGVKGAVLPLMEVLDQFGCEHEAEDGPPDDGCSDRG